MVSYRCSAHKLNLVVKKAINDCDYVKNMLNTLSRFVADTRISLEKSQIHAENKCKLRRQNFTRWNSSFLMLYSFWKSYDKKVFSETYPCPVDLIQIEKYLQILLPIYILSKNFQAANSSICVVFSSLLTVINSNLDRMVISDPNQNMFRCTLIKYLKQKFEYELNSDVYQVAALLNVRDLKDWRDRLLVYTNNYK